MLYRTRVGRESADDANTLSAKALYTHVHIECYCHSNVKSAKTLHKRTYAYVNAESAKALNTLTDVIMHIEREARHVFFTTTFRGQWSRLRTSACERERAKQDANHHAHAYRRTHAYGKGAKAPNNMRNH